MSAERDMGHWEGHTALVPLVLGGRPLLVLEVRRKQHCSVGHLGKSPTAYMCTIVGISSQGHRKWYDFYGQGMITLSSKRVCQSVCNEVRGQTVVSQIYMHVIAH